MKKQVSDRETLDAILGRVQMAPPLEGAGVRPFDEAEPGAADAAGPQPREPRQDLLRTLHLKVRVELGRRRMQLKEALEISPGSILDLEKRSDDDVELFVGELLVARGEVLVVDGCFCIRIKEVMPLPAGGEA